MTSTAKRTHARPPAQLSAIETRAWKALLTDLHRLERGLAELATMKANYLGKQDFDTVARSNARLAANIEEKLVQLETLSAAREAAKRTAS